MLTKDVVPCQVLSYSEIPVELSTKLFYSYLKLLIIFYVYHAALYNLNMLSLIYKSKIKSWVLLYVHVVYGLTQFDCWIKGSKISLKSWYSFVLC